MALTIQQQPDLNTITSAYRPIYFKIGIDSVPTVVYCDTYVNGVFYKTTEKTHPQLASTVASNWEFDIQDVCQEVLKKFIGPNGGSNIILLSSPITTVYCKFRSSTIDINGFTIPESPLPIQATGSTPAVSGGGVVSNTFTVLNAVLQHMDNQDLYTHLLFNGGATSSFTEGESAAATNRKETQIDIYDSDYFPIVTSQDFVCMKLEVKYLGVSASELLPDCVGEVVGEDAGSVEPPPDDDCAFVINGLTAASQSDGFIHLTYTPIAVTTVRLEFSVNGGSTWNPASDYIWDDIDGDITLGSTYSTDQNYRFRLTPTCDNGIDGTAGEADYDAPVIDTDNYGLTYTNNIALNVQVTYGDNGGTPLNTLINETYPSGGITGSNINLPLTNGIVRLSIPSGTGQRIVSATINGSYSPDNLFDYVATWNDVTGDVFINFTTETEVAANTTVLNTLQADTDALIMDVLYNASTTDPYVNFPVPNSESGTASIPASMPADNITVRISTILMSQNVSMQIYINNNLVESDSHLITGNVIISTNTYTFSPTDTIIIQII